MCRADQRARRFFSEHCVCGQRRMFVSVPIDNSARRDSKGCPSERSHKELPRIHGPTFPYTFKQRRTKRTKPEPEHVGLGKRELGKVPPLLARPTTSRSGAPGATLSLHARPPRPGYPKVPISTTGRVRLVQIVSSRTAKQFDHSSHGVPTQESSIFSLGLTPKCDPATPRGSSLRV